MPHMLTNYESLTRYLDSLGLGVVLCVLAALVLNFEPYFLARSGTTMFSTMPPTRFCTESFCRDVGPDREP